jgi:hypothetical protein
MGRGRLELFCDHGDGARTVLPLAAFECEAIGAALLVGANVMEERGEEVEPPFVLPLR